MIARLRCALRQHHQPRRHPLGGFRCVECGAVGADLEDMGRGIRLGRATRRTFDRPQRETRWRRLDGHFASRPERHVAGCLLDEPRATPVGFRVEDDANPAAAADVGRTNRPAVGLDQRLRPPGPRQPDRQVRPAVMGSSSWRRPSLPANRWASVRDLLVASEGRDRWHAPSERVLSAGRCFRITLHGRKR